MAVEIAQFVGGALGGAVVSSVLAPMIGQRKDRRELRASVLPCVSEVERTRSASESSLEEFGAAVRRLRAAALVAGARRDVVDCYIVLAQVARQTSDRSLRLSEGEMVGIPLALSDLVAAAASLVVDHLWHPYRKRVAVAWGLRKARSMERALREDEEVHLDWLCPPMYT